MLAVILGSFGVLFIIVLLAAVAFISCKTKKKMEEEKKEVENMAVDQNPVYQQYELVGPNYERQYSTHEVVDSNT